MNTDQSIRFDAVPNTHSILFPSSYWRGRKGPTNNNV